MNRGEGDDCHLPHHVPALDCHHSNLQFQRSKGHKQRQSFPQHPAPSPCPKYHLYFAQGNSPASSKKGLSQGSRSVPWFAPLLPHLPCLSTVALMWQQSRPILNTLRLSSPTQINTAEDRTDPSFSETKTWKDNKVMGQTQLSSG